MTEPRTDWAQPEGDAPVPSTSVPPPYATPEPGPAVAVQATDPVVKPRPKGGGLTNVLLVVAALVAVGGVTFALGRATATASSGGVSSRSGTSMAGQGAGMPAGSFDPAQGGPPGTGRGGFADRTMTVSGTVQSVDGTTLTITTSDGTSMAIDTTGSTYHAQAAATAADVQAGSAVTVSVSGFGGMGRPDASAAPAASAGTTIVKATDVTITSE
jgi:hypothetical protein